LLVWIRQRLRPGTAQGADAATDGVRIRILTTSYTGATELRAG
tara:strand:- start:441 stop:569 length:129 start_codon:yes stop_codon:yes gene_type:complete